MVNKYCLHCGKELVGKQRKYCCDTCSFRYYNKTHNRGIEPRVKSCVEQEIGIKAKNINEIVKFREEHPEEFIELPYGLGLKQNEGVAYLETHHLMYCDGLSTQIQKELPKIIEDVSNKLLNEELTEEDIIEINERKKKYSQKCKERRKRSNC